jgi:hypothetical protein
MFRISSACGSKKLVMATSYEELVEKASKKLNLNKENVRLYLSDGCEVDDYEGLQFAQEEKAVIYLLEGEETLPGLSQRSCTSKKVTASVTNNEK